MTYATDTTFEAPPEIVFDALTDPLSIARWLPDGVSRNPVGAGLMQVTRESTEPSEIPPAEIGMTYLPAPESPWVAKLLIAALPAGGTNLKVTVEPEEDSDGHVVSKLVESAMAGLHREVDDRFTVG